MRSFYSWAHNFFNEVYCVSEDDKQNFLSLNYKGKIEVTGDARYEQVLWRLENSKTPLEVVKNEKNILIAGSTWEEDENILLESWLKNRDKYRLIIAPHEPSPNHIDALLNFAEKNKCKYQLLSQTHVFDSELLIVDKVGVLASLYSKADIAFIGGAFKGSIHSVMEGLGAGLVCLFGPHHKNNREAIEFQNYSFKEVRYCNAFENAIELSDFLNRNSETIKETALKNLILEKVKSKTGTAAKLKTTVEKHLLSSP
jgi:3-deoxy-D-manno-octulosonic-acid transferase